MKVSDFRQKEVIDIQSGDRLGFVSDVEFSETDGQIKGILIPGAGRFFGLFGGGESLFIPWEEIQKIGEDIILVHSFSIK